MYRLSGEKASWDVPPCHPCIFATRCWVSISRTLMMPSPFLVATHFPSGERTTLPTMPRSVSNNAVGCMVSSSYIHTPTRVATARDALSDENAMSAMIPCPNRAIAPSGSSHVVTSVSSSGLSTGVEVVLFSIQFLQIYFLLV